MDRAAVIEELLDQLTIWTPSERSGMFRYWMRGSHSLVHLHVLTVLESQGPLSMGRLADALDVSVASATGIVDRMEQRGLVERRREPDDRRVVLVHPTEAGQAVFGKMAVERRHLVAWALERMTDRELKAYLIGSRAMRRVRTEAMASAHAAEAAGSATGGSAEATDTAEPPGITVRRRPATRLAGGPA
jgi:DNA-binding MarR family transcriptional regulator